VALVWLAPWAAADDVTLDDGRVITGEVVSDPVAGEIAVKVTVGGMSAIQRFPASRVVSIHRGPGPGDETREAIAQARAKLGSGGEAEAWWALFKQAQALGDTLLERQLAAETAARDRHHAESHQFLGMVRQNGIWMKPAEAAMARGEVRYEGAWMTWDRRQAVVAAEDRRRQEMAAEAQVRAAAARAQAQADAAAEADVYRVQTGDGTTLGLGAGTAPVFPGQVPPAGPAPVNGYSTTLVAIGPTAGPAQPAHVVMWPTASPPPPAAPSGLQIGASGSGKNSLWSFHWSL
jgi:hypothetical protein